MVGLASGIDWTVWSSADSGSASCSVQRADVQEPLDCGSRRAPARHALSGWTRHLRTGRNAGDDSRLQCRGRALTVDSPRHVGMQVPICEIDPWRTQYFESVPCPADVFIPTEDSDAWMWNPAHRWVYDKLAVAAEPGPDSRAAWRRSAELSGVLQAHLQPQGHGRGQPRARSRPTTTPAPTSRVISGRPCSKATMSAATSPWSTASRSGGATRRGVASGAGTFDYWEVHAVPAPAVEDWCGAWCRQHLKGYTGMLNLETIGGRIIEVHLRFADQWPDLYGAWLGRGARPALCDARMAVRRFAHGAPATASCCSCRTAGAIAIRRPTCSSAIAAMPGVSSLQITFHEELPPGPACHAAGRLSRRHRQLLGSRRRQCRARAAACPLRGDEDSRSRSCAAGSRRTG